MTQIESVRTTFGGSYAKPSVNDIIIYHKFLWDFTEGLNFLKLNKNLSEDTINFFKLGFNAPENMISIPETKGRDFVNVAYRSLEDNIKEKYKKIKGCENWIFNERGLDVAREKGGILIVSNQFDCMSAYQAGFKNVVSVPVGKEANGSWMELFDNIPKIYVAFENTRLSKKYALDFASRVGIDKCREINLPEDIIDLNAYFKKYNADDFKGLIVNSIPYYKYKFKGIKDVIDSLKERNDNALKLNCIPFLEFEEDWMVILSGVSNSGKTTLALNVADELIRRGIPTLILPFERGIKTVGKRFLQVHLDKTQQELNEYNETQWAEVVPEIIDLPLYFSVPDREEIKEIVARGKKLFGIKVIIVDHLDYLVRKSTENHNVETSNTLQEFKSLAQEFGIIFIIVHHIKKQEGVGSSPKKPRMEDLKGSSSTYQDPEAVIMLSNPDKNLLEIDIVKNKGPMGSRMYEFNLATGKVGKDVTDIPELLTGELKAQSAFDQM